MPRRSSIDCNTVVICVVNAYFFFCSLKPATKYYYTFGDVYGWSEEFMFKSAPEPGPNVTTRVLAFGGTQIKHTCACSLQRVYYYSVPV